MNDLPKTTISRAEAFLVDLEVETERTDAVQAFLKQETVFVELETTDGFVGLGYSYTIGTGGTAVLAMLRDHLLPRLVGADARNVEAIWFDLFASTRATTVGAITSLALASVDTALWDLRCRRAGEPLWRLAGGFRRRVPLYDTEGGWLHLTTDQLVSRRARLPEGGLARGETQGGQAARARGPGAAERSTGGGRVAALDIMVDANQSMTYAEAKRRANAFEPLDLSWFEEPLPADDLTGHVRLAESTSIPIAVGESMYSISQFREYVAAGAAGIVQVDVARVGGITPWLKVAHLAETFNLEVCPHFLMEIHVSLTAAVPNGRYVEHIPQLRAITKTEMEIADGHAVAPDEPGLGIDWDRDAIDDRRVS